jgi:Nitrile hydratase, alpha chain
VLTEKGYVDPAAIDLIIDAYETKIGPHNGARIVTKAWSDPAFKRALIDDGTKAVRSFGIISRVGDHSICWASGPEDPQASRRAHQSVLALPGSLITAPIDESQRPPNAIV